jgi:hypothetical protein
MQLAKRMLIMTAALMLWQYAVPFQMLEAQPQFMLFQGDIARPDGITVDAQGRVLVHSENLNKTEAIQFNANGDLLTQVIFGDGVFDKTRFIGSRFTYDPLLNYIIMLTPEGELFLINPDGLQVLPNVILIPPATINTSNVYDINTGQTVSVGFALDTVLRYGDLALFHPGPSPAQLTLMFTGTAEPLSEPPFPFVMEFDIDLLTSTIAAQIVLTSSAVSFISEHRTRGVAVNRYGIGLTTLPIFDSFNPDETKEVAVTFPVYTALGATGLLPQPVVLFDELDVTSNGMASDRAGHFYAASGDQGSSACEPHRSGALIVMPVDDNGLPLGLVPSANAVPAAPTPLGVLNQLACFPVATTPDDIVSSRDVAVSPVDQSVFLTVNNTNLILVISQP